MSQTYRRIKIGLPATLSCTVSKIKTIRNNINIDMLSEYHQYMGDRGASKHHQITALGTVISYAKFLGENCEEPYRSKKKPLSKLPATFD